MANTKKAVIAGCILLMAFSVLSAFEGWHGLGLLCWLAFLLMMFAANPGLRTLPKPSRTLNILLIAGAAAIPLALIVSYTFAHPLLPSALIIGSFALVAFVTVWRNDAKEKSKVL